MMKKCGGVWGLIVWLLVIVGALNWGLVGLGGFFNANWNIVNLIFGSIMWLEYLIYVLVGVAGLMTLFHSKKCARCNTAHTPAAPAESQPQM